MADQQQLYSSISEMKIATPVKVEVFTEEDKGEKEIKRESYATCRPRGLLEHGC